VVVDAWMIKPPGRGDSVAATNSQPQTTMHAKTRPGLDDNTVIIHLSDNGSMEQLFDLAADPHEEKDLARDRAQASILKTLRARCDAYCATLQ